MRNARRASAPADTVSVDDVCDHTPSGRDLIDRLVSALVLDEIDTVNAPHIVLICDPYVAELSAYGPFTDALAAATVAEQIREQMEDDEHRCVVDAVVIPLRAFVPGAG